MQVVPCASSDHFIEVQNKHLKDCLHNNKYCLMCWLNSYVNMTISLIDLIA